jgi:hypothetical protein
VENFKGKKNFKILCSDPAAYIKPWPLQMNISLNFKQKRNHKYLAKGQWHEIFKKLNKNNSHYARGNFSTSEVTFKPNSP